MGPQQDIHSKHYIFGRVVGAVLAMILIVGGVLFYRKSITPIPPTALSDEQIKLNELARLEASSNPITTTLQERTDNLVKLDKDSKSITTTFENRLQVLKVLSQ